MDNIAVFNSVGRHVQAGSWHLGPQTHPFHELVVVLSGEQDTKICGTRVSARAGDILLYPAGCSHDEWSHKGSTLESIFIWFDWPGLATDAPFVFSDDRGRIRVMAEWLYAERKARTQSSRELSTAILHSVTAECASLWKPRERTLVDDVRRYVERHISEPITLADLAGELELSRYHLIRKYRQLTGQTPMADVTRLRVEHARNLILTTALPLKRIAPAVGLGDVYRMCRLFRKHLGITPGSLRRR